MILKVNVINYEECFMYAIAFDLKIDDLRKEYGDPYNKAYDEIRQELESI